MTLRRVWGSAQPYGQSAPTDGTPNIRLCSLFYMLAGQTWDCVGGRVFIPNFPGVLATGIRIMAWAGVHESPIDIGASPLRSAETTTPASTGWVEVSWAAFPVVGGTTAVAIGYEFTTVGATYLFTSAAAVGTPAVQALDGSPLYFAEQAYTGSRSRYKQGAGAVGGTNGWYGSDIALDDGETAEPEAVQVHWNDDGVQRTGRLYYDNAPVLGVAQG